MADEPKQTKEEKPVTQSNAAPASAEKTNSGSEKNPVSKEFTSTLLNSAPWAAGGGLLGALGGFLFTEGGENESSSDRMKRRIRNAIRLGAMGTGLGGATSIIKDMLEDDSTKFKDEAEDLFYRLGKGFHKTVNLFAKSDPRGIISGAIYGGIPGVGLGLRSGIKKAIASRAAGLKAVQSALGNHITEDILRKALDTSGKLTNLAAGTPYARGTTKYPIILESARSAVGKGSGNVYTGALKGGTTKGLIGGGIGALFMPVLEWLTRDPNKPGRD